MYVCMYVCTYVCMHVGPGRGHDNPYRSVNHSQLLVAQYNLLCVCMYVCRLVGSIDGITTVSYPEYLVKFIIIIIIIIIYNAGL